jgi:hypothetical protein
MSPTEIYRGRIAALDAALLRLKRTKNRIAWVRLATIVTLAMAAWYLYPVGLLFAAMATFGLLALFIRLVAMAAGNKSIIEHTTRLKAINQQEISIAGGQYTHLPDGTAFMPPVHDYAGDLDIFGRASVYQYINRTVSQQGNAALAGWLLHPSPSATIRQRQEAAKELAPQFQWRQELQAYGEEQPVSILTEEKVAGWVSAETHFGNQWRWKLLKWGYPLLTLSLLLLYITGILPNKWFYALVILFIACSSYISKIITGQYIELNKIVPEITVLGKTAAIIEKMQFKTGYLLQLQQHFMANNTPASRSIRQLKAILDRFDYRLNPLVFIPLNAFLLWDLQLIFQLENWKAKHRAKAAGWFTALGETEAIASLAAIEFNHPVWAYPLLDEGTPGLFRAEALGHPLIAENKRVCNSFTTTGEAQLSLITGSNMAGKSTFLRSIGVNMVLAMMGAPVCAGQLQLSPMQVISSMRVADNLEESASTFYAELKKLKRIIEAVNNREKVFVLLDEILRGTNSLDRHTGSEALVKQLIRHKAAGILATHDLDLAKLAGDFPQQIHNYHFDVQVNKEELFFDYKLKEGVCQSLNASILMKKIGIEL